MASGNSSVATSSTKKKKKSVMKSIAKGMRDAKKKLRRQDFIRYLADIERIPRSKLSRGNKRWMLAFPQCVLYGLYGAIAKRAFLSACKLMKMPFKI